MPCLNALVSADESQTRRALAAGGDPDKPVSDPDIRVLLVDDNPVNQEVAMLMLRQIGCHTEIAEDGRAGLRAFREGTYDLVLMDCQMPTMDGFAATRAIREWEQRMGKSATPIIALTANALKDDRERCLAAGMNEYLSKPLSIQKLKNIMADYVDGLPTGSIDEAGARISATAEPSNAAEGASPVIDVGALENIRKLQKPGEPELLPRVISLYMDNALALKERLCEAITALDASEIREAAHALKSMSTSVGAIRLIEMCGQLEMLGRQHELSTIGSLQDDLISEYQKVIAALETESRKVSA